MTSSGFYGWKLLTALWCILFINLAFPGYGYTIMNTYMVADLRLDRTTLGILASLYMMMTGLPGPLIAISVNKLGVRMTLVSGTLLLIIGSLLMALYVSNALQAILVFGILIGLSVLTGGTLAAQSCVAYWFVRRRPWPCPSSSPLPGLAVLSPPRY